MNDEQLGFDPIVTIEDGWQFITVNQRGRTEQPVISGLMMQASYIAGQATTCWKAYCEDSQVPLLVKDFWQYTEPRKEEGELLKKETGKRVVNVASATITRL